MSVLIKSCIPSKDKLCVHLYVRTLSHNIIPIVRFFKQKIVLPVVNSPEKLWPKESNLFMITHQTYNTRPKSISTARILASGQRVCLMFRVRSCQSRSKKGVITLKVSNQVICRCPQTVISLHAHRTSRADLSARACVPCSHCVAETLK